MNVRKNNYLDTKFVNTTSKSPLSPLMAPLKFLPSSIFPLSDKSPRSCALVDDISLLRCSDSFSAAAPLLPLIHRRKLSDACVDPLDSMSSIPEGNIDHPLQAAPGHSRRFSIHAIFSSSYYLLGDAEDGQGEPDKGNPDDSTTTLETVASETEIDVEAEWPCSPMTSSSPVRLSSPVSRRRRVNRRRRRHSLRVRPVHN